MRWTPAPALLDGTDRLRRAVPAGRARPARRRCAATTPTAQPRRAWMLGRFVVPAARLEELVPWPGRPCWRRTVRSVAPLPGSCDPGRSPTTRFAAARRGPGREALELKGPTCLRRAWLDQRDQGRCRSSRPTDREVLFVEIGAAGRGSDAAVLEDPGCRQAAAGPAPGGQAAVRRGDRGRWFPAGRRVADVLALPRPRRALKSPPACTIRCAAWTTPAPCPCTAS